MKKHMVGESSGKQKFTPDKIDFTSHSDPDLLKCGAFDQGKRDTQ